MGAEKTKLWKNRNPSHRRDEGHVLRTIVQQIIYSQHSLDSAPSLTEGLRTAAAAFGSLTRINIDLKGEESHSIFLSARQVQKDPNVFMESDG